MKWVALLGMGISLCSCIPSSQSHAKKDLDKPPPMFPPGYFSDIRDRDCVVEFEQKANGVWKDSILRVLEAARSYRYLGDSGKVRSLYWKIRDMRGVSNAEPSNAVFMGALFMSDVFFEFQQWDSAWYYLEVADSFRERFVGMREWEKDEYLRANRSDILERQGKVDAILKTWRSQCLGGKEEILARALRKKFGKERMKFEIEKAMANPKVSPATLIWEKGHRLFEQYTVLPDGDSVPMRDFGGLFVRLDLPEKSCYLWAPTDQDSINSLPAYLNNFRKTRFCKILQDIDPDARE